MITSSKSKTHLAYVRSGKAISKPKIDNQINLDTTEEYCKHPTRNSTGNIYDSIIGQIQSDQQDYIKSLISRNQKETTKGVKNNKKKDPKQFKQCSQLSKKNLHERTKSQAEMQALTKNFQNNNNVAKDILKQYRINSKGKQHSDQTILKQRQQRDTHKKGYSPSSKVINNNFFSCKVSPKNQNNLQNPNFILSKNQFAKLQNKHCQQLDGSLLKSIDSYLQALNIQSQQSHQISPFNFNETNPNILQQTNKFQETLNFSKDQKIVLLKKLQKQKRKVNQMKFAMKFCKQEYKRQFQKTQKKQKKMKNQLIQMLNQIKFLNQQLNKQKHQKRKLQKAVHHFEESIQRMKPQRRMIGAKNKNSNNPTKYQINLQATQNEDQEEYKQTEENIAQEWENYRQQIMNRSSHNGKFFKDKSIGFMNNTTNFNKDRLSNSKNKTINMARNSNPLKHENDSLMYKMKSPKNAQHNKNNVQYFKSRFYMLSSDQEDCEPQQQVSSFQHINRHNYNRYGGDSSQDYEN